MGIWCVTRCASFRFAGRSSKTPLKALTAPWVALTQQDRGWKFNFSQTSFPFYASPVRILLSCRNHSVLICLVFLATLSLQCSHLVDFLPDGNSFPPAPPSKCRNYTIYYTNTTTSTNTSTYSLTLVSEQTLVLVPVISLVQIFPLLNADTYTSTNFFISTNTSTNISTS